MPPTADLLPGTLDALILKAVSLERLHGYGADGKPAGKSGLKEDDAMTVEECARQVIQAMRTRKRELVMTPKARIGLWLKLIAPRLVDQMTLAAVKREG